MQAPKKAKLAEAENELATQMDKLNEKRRQLQQVRHVTDRGPSGEGVWGRENGRETGEIDLRDGLYV